MIEIIRDNVYTRALVKLGEGMGKERRRWKEERGKGEGGWKVEFRRRIRYLQ
jgi:hypothetical protein